MPRMDYALSAKTQTSPQVYTLPYLSFSPHPFTSLYISLPLSLSISVPFWLSSLHCPLSCFYYHPPSFSLSSFSVLFSPPFNTFLLVISAQCKLFLLNLKIQIIIHYQIHFFLLLKLILNRTVIMADQSHSSWSYAKILRAPQGYFSTKNITETYRKVALLYIYRRACKIVTLIVGDPRLAKWICSYRRHLKKKYLS